MRHHKEVWKQKFKLIFSLCPGFGREELQLIDWLSIWKYLSKNMWSFVKKIWVAIKWCTLEWFFAFFLISNRVFTLFFCLGLQSYWWKDTFYRTFECLVLKYRDIPSQSFASIVLEFSLNFLYILNTLVASWENIYLDYQLFKLLNYN